MVSGDMITNRPLSSTGRKLMADLSRHRCQGDEIELRPAVREMLLVLDECTNVQDATYVVFSFC